jgi:hypothetical protein
VLTVDATAGVAAALASAGEAFGPVPDAGLRPRWGALYARLDAAPGPEYVSAIELIYEGYLLHYRESRVFAPGPGDLAARLLAGDCFYARGLRSIAALGDVDAVGLLARLMAACSYLRHVEAPFADDDALWAYAMGGLAAQHSGVPPATCAALFDDIDAALGATAPDVPAAVATAVRRLGLTDPGPLLDELKG